MQHLLEYFRDFYALFGVISLFKIWLSSCRRQATQYRVVSRLCKLAFTRERSNQNLEKHVAVIVSNTEKLSLQCFSSTEAGEFVDEFTVKVG